MFSQVSVCPQDGGRGLCLGVFVQGGLCEGDPPVQLLAGGMHPTGMHSCLLRSQAQRIFL